MEKVFKLIVWMASMFTVQACNRSVFVPNDEDLEILKADDDFANMLTVRRTSKTYGDVLSQIYEAFMNSVFGYDSELTQEAFVESVV